MDQDLKTQEPEANIYGGYGEHPYGPQEVDDDDEDETS